MITKQNSGYLLIFWCFILEVSGYLFRVGNKYPCAWEGFDLGTNEDKG
ncbi:hypothetical protein VISP3789_03486 [Vibrio splendidus ATCC 33789]|nr:hypothetical protein VISP3789_03486 [Vibrio splendidus ATCC 33789]